MTTLFQNAKHTTYLFIKVLFCTILRIQNFCYNQHMENIKPEIKFNHLENNFQPIRVCIHNKDASENSPFVENYKHGNSFEDVDYSASTDYYKSNGMLNGGWETYVISDVNSKDKFTKGLYDCTGFIVVAEDKGTNQNISILSHQDPKEFLEPELISSFKTHLSESLKKFWRDRKKEVLMQ